MYCDKNKDDNVEKMIYKLYEYADNSPYPNKWLDECVEKYESADNFYESIWGNNNIQRVRGCINNAKVYTSNKDYSNYVFFKTKYMCSDKDGNTIFGDFLTGEVRSILESKKKSVRVDKFMSSSDNYSVAVLLDDNKNTFYIFYL